MIQALSLLLTIYTFILFIDIIFSWVRPDPYCPLGGVMRVIHMLTEPVLEPLRRLIPPAGGLDFSPLIAFLIIRAIQMALTA